MNPLISSPTSYIHRSMTQSYDIEMLQTDVMRFFAILCLCLMAIFTLVKALPMSPPADRPTLVKPTDLNTEAAALQQEIAVLKEKLVKVQARLNQATAFLEKSEARAADASAVEKQTMSQLSENRRELAAVSQSLKKARSEIYTREATLARIVKDITEKRRIQSELKRQIENETHKFQKLQTSIDRATAKLSQAAQPEQMLPKNTPPAPVPKPPAPKQPDPKQPARKGLTLRFASEKALETLISQKKVQFFALVGRKAWQLKIANGRPVYTAVQNPSKIYEMETTTVPVTYVDRFSRQVAAFGRSKITWGVTLPNQTSAAINRLIKDREGGDLIIMPDGEVILN